MKRLRQPTSTTTLFRKGSQWPGWGREDQRSNKAGNTGSHPLVDPYCRSPRLALALVGTQAPTHHLATSALTYKLWFLTPDTFAPSLMPWQERGHGLVSGTTNEEGTRRDPCRRQKMRRAVLFAVCVKRRSEESERVVVWAERTCILAQCAKDRRRYPEGCTVTHTPVFVMFRA